MYVCMYVCMYIYIYIYIYNFFSNKQTNKQNKQTKKHKFMLVVFLDQWVNLILGLFVSCLTAFTKKLHTKIQVYLTYHHITFLLKSV